MIKLYERDAAEVTEVLTLVGDFLHTDAGAAEYTALMNWLPSDTADMQVSDNRKKFLRVVRLRAIVAAIDEQRGHGGRGAAEATRKASG